MGDAGRLRPPISNIRRSSKPQTSKASQSPFLSLEFEVSLDVGAWSLEFHNPFGHLTYFTLLPLSLFSDPTASAKSSANPSTSSAVVSHAHISRASPSVPTCV